MVQWNDIKRDPPKQLKISPLAMVPHKSRPFRAILDLSFSVKLSPTDSIPSINSTTTKLAPANSINQLGHSLLRVINTFATAPATAKIFMAKWDIKDSFWHLDCEAGEEWNFTYVLPSTAGSDDITLIVPTSLQMGWIESPPYFCSASEMARDTAATYAELPRGQTPSHPFLPLTQTSREYQLLLDRHTATNLHYMMEVFVNDFIALAMPTTRSDLDHIATAMMCGIHDVFPPTAMPECDPISDKKLRKGEGAWALIKDILGLTFDGTEHTIWLASEK
jgi:hypothetical protein